MAKRVDKPNASAEDVAFGRALSRALDPPLVRNPDHMAKEFLGPRYKPLFLIPPFRPIARRVWQRMMPGIPEWINARTHHIDRTVQEAVRAGASQVLLLGAGYDSRAYRLDELATVAVFEVDQPATSRRKQKIVHRVFGRLPTSVRYLAVDLAKDDLFAALERAGFDRSQATIIVAEGVMYYFDEAQSDSLLSAIRQQMRGPVTIVFDYLYREALDERTVHPDAVGAVNYLRKHNHPYKSGIPQGAAAAYISARGFELVADLSPADMEDRYLRRADGTVSGPAFVAYGMATLRLPGQR